MMIAYSQEKCGLKLSMGLLLDNFSDLMQDTKIGEKQYMLRSFQSLVSVIERSIEDDKYHE